MMLTNIPPVGPILEMLLKLCKEEYAILQPISFTIDNQFHVEIGLYVCWHESYTLLVRHIQYAAGDVPNTG